MNNVSKYIDHTNLRPDAIESDIIKLCKEALAFKFASVCINPIHVPLAVSILQNEKIKVSTVVGFPLGATSSEMKFAESRFLTHQGAEELDMVINIGALKQKEYGIVENDIARVVDAADGNPVKVIIETCLLNEEEMLRACKIILNAGAAYVKTSTGFSTEGARVEDIKLIKKNVGKDLGIKASGGIKTLEEVELMISAGANRIGTSKSVIIVS
tara:strand:- start:89 stop:730 length:642 start_codon:yes stop_codon:yes gene_type:complete